MTCPVFTCTVAYTGQVTFYKVPGTRYEGGGVDFLFPPENIKIFSWNMEMLLKMFKILKMFKMFNMLSGHITHFFIISLLCRVFYSKHKKNTFYVINSQISFYFTDSTNQCKALHVILIRSDVKVFFWALKQLHGSFSDMVCMRNSIARFVHAWTINKRTMDFIGVNLCLKDFQARMYNCGFYA